MTYATNQTENDNLERAIALFEQGVPVQDILKQFPHVNPELAALLYELDNLTCAGQNIIPSPTLKTALWETLNSEQVNRLRTWLNSKAIKFVAIPALALCLMIVVGAVSHSAKNSTDKDLESIQDTILEENLSEQNAAIQTKADAQTATSDSQPINDITQYPYESQF